MEGSNICNSLHSLQIRYKDSKKFVIVVWGKKNTFKFYLYFKLKFIVEKFPMDKSK